MCLMLLFFLSSFLAYCLASKEKKYTFASEIVQETLSITRIRLRSSTE